MQSRAALFLSLMVTNCSGERSFSRFKRIKNELKGHNVPGEVVPMSTLSIRYIKSGKLRQTNGNEFSYNFVMKKEGQNLFNCLLCYLQPYLNRWL